MAISMAVSVEILLVHCCRVAYMWNVYVDATTGNMPVQNICVAREEWSQNYLHVTAVKLTQMYNMNLGIEDTNAISLHI